MQVESDDVLQTYLYLNQNIYRFWKDHWNVESDISSVGIIFVSDTKQRAK